MTDPTAIYLGELERAVHDLPQPLARDILSGIREELRALDDAAARARIAELGDPAFIAASARDELPAVVSAGDPFWYTVLIALLLSIGGFVVPVVGWIVGVALLWNSRLWTRRDKIVGTALWPVLTALILGIGVVVASVVDGGQQQTLEEPVNPLVPGAFDLTHSAVIVSFVVVPIVTLAYLLVRAKRLRA